MSNTPQNDPLVPLADGTATVVALSEGFDDAAGFTASTPFFSDGFADYFGIAGPVAQFGTGPAPAQLSVYTGTDGGYLTGQDLDGEGASLPITAEWSGIDITGLSDLTFSGRFAERVDGLGHIDASDYLRIEARVDGGTWQTVLAFVGADFSSGSFNGVFRQDTDLDGIGDGPALSAALQGFSAGIAGSGTTLDLRVVARVDAGDEDFAIDDISVVGTGGGAATPAVIARTGDGLAVAEAGATTDSFTLELTTAPAAAVAVTVTAPDDQTLISLDGENFGASAVASLTGTDPVRVFVRAIDDGTDEAASHDGRISFAVTSADPAYDGAAIRELTVTIADDDTRISRISDIQGSGAASGLVGQQVTVEAVVTGIITNGSGAQVGYFLQEEDADRDGDAATSEAIYVFSGQPVAVGDQLRLTGTVGEFSGQTQLSGIADLQVLATGQALPTVTRITLGLRDGFEAFESMRVELVTGSEDPLSVVTNFNLDRYGEIEVAEGTLVTPTQIFDAQTQADEVAALSARNAAARLIIDDSSTGQNLDRVTMIDSGDGTSLQAGDPLDAAGPTLRLGTQLSGVTGILDERFGGYRIQVDRPLDVIEGSGDRPAAAPDVGGDIQIASFNVLNYFTTLDANGALTGPNGDQEPRGATSAADLARQTDKLVAAITQMDAEAIALQEIENNGFGEGSAIATLVDALNAATAPGTYAFVDPGVAFLGDDAITTAIIYKPGELTLTGSAFKVFDETSSARTQEIVDQIQQTTGTVVENLQRSRPSLAATFEDADGGEVTIVANHLKSKGASGLDTLAGRAGTMGVDPDLIAQLRADPNFDQGDGQGFWNGVRAEAAGELVDWLAQNPTGAQSTANQLLLGDLNSYAREDPVQVLEAAGLTDLARAYLGDDAYSYSFDGQRGTLDYGLASQGLLDEVTGAAEWHINADEPDLFSYASNFNDARFYNADPFAVSDHDPLLVGLTLSPRQQLVDARVDFEDRGWLLNRVSYAEDGVQLSNALAAPVGAQLRVRGSDITVTSSGPGPDLLTLAGKGLGVQTIGRDRLLSAEARLLDQHEELIFRLDDGGRLGDATAADLTLLSVRGGAAGQVTLAFYDDGVLVDRARMGAGDGALAHRAAAAFDEMRVGTTGDLAFELGEVGFTRIEDDSFVFV